MLMRLKQFQRFISVLFHHVRRALDITWSTAGSASEAIVHDMLVRYCYDCYSVEVAWSLSADVPALGGVQDDDAS